MTTPYEKALVEDRRLDEKRSQTQEELAELRWHWTLDESNPDRVSIRQYARDVGRSEATIRKYANGYAAWVRTNGTHKSIDDAIVLANMNTETAAATEAVAKEAGVTVGTASNAGQYRAEVREVLATARERAERRQTSILEEVADVAKQRAEVRKAQVRITQERAARHSLRYIEIEGYWARAKQALESSLEVSNDVPFTGEEVALLVATLNNLKALIRMLDVRFIGDSGTDWDAELARLEA